MKKNPVSGTDSKAWEITRFEKVHADEEQLTGAMGVVVFGSDKRRASWMPAAKTHLSPVLLRSRVLTDR